MQPTVGCFSWLKGKLWGLLGDLCLGLFPTPPPWHPVVVCEGGACTPSSAGKQAVCGRVVHSRQVGTACSGVRLGWPTPSDTVPASVCWHGALERPMGLVHPRKSSHQRVPCSSPSLPLLRPVAFPGLRPLISILQHLRNFESGSMRDGRDYIQPPPHFLPLQRTAGRKRRRATKWSGHWKEKLEGCVWVTAYQCWWRFGSYLAWELSVSFPMLITPWNKALVIWTTSWQALG